MNCLRFFNIKDVNIRKIEEFDILNIVISKIIED